MKNIEVYKSFLIKLIQSAKQLDNKIIFDLLDNLDKLPQPLNGSDLDKLIENLSLNIENFSDKEKREIFNRKYETLPLSVKKENKVPQGSNPYRSSKGLFDLIVDFVSNSDTPPTSTLYLYMALKDLSSKEIDDLIEYSKSKSKPLTISNLESIIKEIYNLYKDVIDSGNFFAEENQNEESSDISSLPTAIK